MVVLQAIYPSPVLRDYVRVHRIVHFNFQNNDLVPGKAYPPRPENTLSFYPYDGEVVKYQNKEEAISNLRCALVGQHHQVSMRYVGKHFLCVQVVFQPGALFRLTGIPAQELVNSYVDAELVFNSEIKTVNEKLQHAKQYEEMIFIIEDFLVRLIQRKRKDNLPIDWVNKMMVSEGAIKSVDQLAHDACLSIKQFERIFLDRVGLPPKYFARIVRFEKAYRAHNLNPSTDWLTTALDCGYYDYQHMARDYKEFTGLTPIAFHHLDQKAPESSFGSRDTF